MDSSLHGRPSAGIELRWVHSVAAGGIFSLFLLAVAASGIAFPSTSLFLHPYASSATQRPSPAGPPRFAYLVSGSAGDAGRLRRCLLALYHPRNHYILRLDAEASDSERTELAAFVAAHPVLAAVGNVRVLEKANLVTYVGITMVTTTLHAAATFLRGPRADWDWFINLSASDYPLVTQDDLMDVFSRLPRDLNFIDHSSDMGWKASARAMAGIVDPGHYMKTKRYLMWMKTETEKRELPTTLNDDADANVADGPMPTVAVGIGLSRRGLGLCRWLGAVGIVGHSGSDMHYISWGDSPGHHPELINSSHWDGMLGSDAPFACKFGQDDPVLDRIDAELLSRQPGMLAPGSWSIGDIGGDGSYWIVRDTAPLSEENFRPKQCKIVDHNA